MCMHGSSQNCSSILIQTQQLPVICYSGSFVKSGFVYPMSSITFPKAHLVFPVFAVLSTLLPLHPYCSPYSCCPLHFLLIIYPYPMCGCSALFFLDSSQYNSVLHITTPGYMHNYTLIRGLNKQLNKWVNAWHKDRHAVCFYSACLEQENENAGKQSPSCMFCCSQVDGKLKVETWMYG